MNDYLIYQGDRLVGKVVDYGGGRVMVDSRDPGLQTAVDAVLKEPAFEMVGGEEDGVFWDAPRGTTPSDPDHVRVALTGGALVRHGYVGVAARTAVGA